MMTPSVNEIGQETENFLRLLQWSISNSETETDFESAAGDRCMRKRVIDASSDGDDDIGGKGVAPKRFVNSDCEESSGYGETDSEGSGKPSTPEDTIDGFWSNGGTPVPILGRPQLQTSVTYDKKTVDEQEALHKFIAEKLNEIATEIDTKYGAKTVSAGDLIRVPNYEAFASTISIAIGSDPGIQQLAIFYRLSLDAVVAAASSEMTAKITNWVKTYFSERLAAWVVRQHGLKSCVAAAAKDGFSSA